jgi:hypothetical protein
MMPYFLAAILLFGVVLIAILGIQEFIANRPSVPVTVNYRNGYPDFSPFMRHPSGVKSIKIEVTSNNWLDYHAANRAAGHLEWGNAAPEGWIWHRQQDTKTMMLVPYEIHSQFLHTGRTRAKHESKTAP